MDAAHHRHDVADRRLKWVLSICKDRVSLTPVALVFLHLPTSAGMPRWGDKCYAIVALRRTLPTTQTSEENPAFLPALRGSAAERECEHDATKKGVPSMMRQVSIRTVPAHSHCAAGNSSV